MRQLTRRQRRAAIALALVALLFCVFDIAGAPFENARSGTQGYLGGLYRGTDSVVGPVRRFVQGVPKVNSDTDTISALRAKVAELERQRATATQDAATSAQLTALQLQATRGGYSVLPARVTAIGPDGGFDWTVVLDAGSSDGIRVDQTVIAGPALVGRVIRVSASSSTVLLAADPRSGVGARNSRDAQIGMVTGKGTSGFTYSALDPNAVTKVGDVLVTGPTGATTYLPGLAIGTVRTVVPQPDGTTLSLVTPAITATTLDLVGVILIGGRELARSTLSPGPTSVPNAAPAPTVSPSPAPKTTPKPTPSGTR
ncbi:MAG: merC [Pseudonocardiales bacterium]|nr:merC [Pseudonocardiales bacterium]